MVELVDTRHLKCLQLGVRVPLRVPFWSIKMSIEEFFVVGWIGILVFVFLLHFSGDCVFGPSKDPYDY